MSTFKPKKSIKYFFYSPLSVCVLFLLTILMTKGAWNAYQKSQDAQNSLSESERAQAGLIDRQAFLSKEIDRLGTESGQEGELRSKYSLAKGDEQMVIIVDQEGSSSSKSDTQSGGFWQKFLNLFK